MKKIYLLFMSFVCLCTLNAFADCGCNKNHTSRQIPTYTQLPQKNCNKPIQTPCHKPCEKQQSYDSYATPCSTDKFLCTNKDMNTLFKQIGLSETQTCTAMKIQDKYAQEVLSLNERIECEKAKLCQLEKNCAKGSEIRKQKRLIKKLEKDRKKICKCYEKQFKYLLSNTQIKAYNKYKK